MGLVRGCGTRKAGGVYAEVPMSEGGMPIEYFLVDPPVMVDADTMGLSRIGVKLIQRMREETYDIWDIIGQDSYPNVADFIEEARRYGVSRRLAQTLDFKLLTPKSRLILLHERAFIENPADYINAGTKYTCPKNLPDHQHNVKRYPTCLGLCWSDIEPEPTVGDKEATEEKTAPDWDSADKHPLTVTRVMPAFSYSALRRPDGVEPKYKLAIFASFPIGNLAVINDPVGGTHEKSMAAAAAAKLEVKLEDE